ncbi:MAG: AAA family ATPase [Spirochaetes bacterium]|nr:AAA family ATPase [Spirochaetota bacterium]
MLFRDGLIIGKFMPIHAGHVAMAGFASAHCESVDVLVGALPGEPIPGPLRFEWARDTLARFPNVRVSYTEEELPSATGSSREVSKVWAAWLKPRFPAADAIVSSEPYGAFLAGYLGIGSLPFDPGRTSVPISATAIRGNPFAAWDFIPRAVRPWFAKTVCLYGPESTGKTSMAERLARRFGCGWVPEMARFHIGDRAPVRADIDAIAPIHATAIREARKEGFPLLFVDSDLETTRIYADRLFDYRPEFPDWIEEENRYDLHLLFYPDTPWVDDVQRSPQADRIRMFELFQARLDAKSSSFAVIRGGWEGRERGCIAAILERWPGLERFLGQGTDSRQDGPP